MSKSLSFFSENFLPEIVEPCNINIIGDKNSKCFISLLLEIPFGNMEGLNSMYDPALESVLTKDTESLIILIAHISDSEFNILSCMHAMRFYPPQRLLYIGRLQ